MHDPKDLVRHFRTRTNHLATPCRTRSILALGFALVLTAHATVLFAHGDGDAERGIVLTAAQREEFGIEVRAVGPANIDIIVELPGEVRPNQERIAHLVPRFAGIAVSVRSHIGDEVEAGEILAEIESSQSLSRYSLRSLMKGTVLARHLTLGEQVSQDTQVFTVANLDTVWVDLSVYQSDQARVRVGNPVRVSASRDHVSARERIAYVSPILDVVTRTATARVILPNLDRRWKPGLFVTGEVTVDSNRAAISVPRSALQEVGGVTVVFVLEGDTFSPRPVTTGLSDHENVEVLEGLTPGESCAVQGSFLLKSELEKSGFGE